MSSDRIDLDLPPAAAIRGTGTPTFGAARPGMGPGGAGPVGVGRGTHQRSVTCPSSPSGPRTVYP
jgi:hypothetical protein